jgi:large subunit ribosomal protein L18
MANKSRADIRKAIHGRIRLKVSGTTDRPRLAVYRSTNHIYAQVIDDRKGVTLVAASSLDNDLKGKNGGNIEGAKTVGKAIAERAIKEGIEYVVYDRGGYVYHGRVKALIDASREAGLNKDSNGSAAPKAEKKADAEESKKEDTKKEAKPKKAEKDEAKKEKAEKANKKSKEKTEEKTEPEAKGKSAETKSESKEKTEEVTESDDSKEGDNE